MSEPKVLPESRYMTPAEIVEALDNYIIGQKRAKKAVAIALRNRWRRQQIKGDMKDEIMPKNIIMIGPTGVGKTEIARRLAKLDRAPFIKVEASKFTEVGYVGRDVESIIRDLVKLAVRMVKEEHEKAVRPKARMVAEERLLDILVPMPAKPPVGEGRASELEEDSYRRTREKMRELLRQGKLDEREVEVVTQEKAGPVVEIFSSMGMEEMDINFKDMLGNLMPKKSKRVKMTVKEALEMLEKEEAQHLVDMNKVTKEAIHRVEQNGMVFIDEIDKVAGRETGKGPDVSREGVQRDLLPLVEGTTVNTKYGPVRTDHILFVAAGAFHVAKPSDLIPELQGRFPIRIELDSLTTEDFVRILTEPRNALIKQYQTLMATEGIELEFTKEAIEEIASIAAEVNQRTENIGARRLYTVMEKLLEDLSFEAPNLSGQRVTVDVNYVREKLADIAQDMDLSRYIL